jgi:hypothetical protein
VFDGIRGSSLYSVAPQLRTRAELFYDGAPERRTMSDQFELPEDPAELAAWMDQFADRLPQYAQQLVFHRMKCRIGNGRRSRGG